MSFPPGVFILQYLPECDELVLMKDGQIAEHGTHTQLMEKGRDYAALFNSVQQEVCDMPPMGKHQGHTLTKHPTSPTAKFMNHGLQSFWL